MLRRTPTIFFSVHLLNLDGGEAGRRRQDYTALQRHLVVPQAEASVAGKLDPSRLSPIERLMARAARAPAGDQRDWPAIEAWAAEILSVI